MKKPTMATRLLLPLLLLLTIDDATCDFGGAAATLTEIDPSSKNSTYPATAAASATNDGATASSPAASKALPWCVCRPDLPDAALQQTLDYACDHGADCGALRPGGQCHVPNTLLAHCSYAVNSYFQSNKDAACDIAGAALSSKDPSSGTCKYPATEHATSPAPATGTWNMLLLFLLVGLTVCVFYIVILCSMECRRAPSTRAMVSGGAAVDEETGTAAVAVEETESPVTSTCTVCYEAWTNQGPHRISYIPCGHVYGRSCLERWLMQHGNSTAQCPECAQTFQLREIINLYGPEEASQS